MEAFWGELFERHVARYDKETVHKCGHIDFINQLKQRIHHNRELYLSFIAAVVLNDARPSRKHGPPDVHPDDVVNYLACSCVEELLGPLEEDKVCDTPISSDITMPVTFHRLARCHVFRVATCTRQLLPSPTSTETCKSQQLVPPRYQHYFPSGICRLSDLDALQLLVECHPQFKTLEIIVRPFDDTMPWGELSGVLSKLLTSVESVTLRARASDRVPLALLTALFMKERLALSVLHISRLDKTMMKSLAPLSSAQPIGTPPAVLPNVVGLQAPFCALTELTIQFAYPSPSSSVYKGQLEDDNATALASIIEHQTWLQVLTVGNLHPAGACPRLCVALQSLCQQPLFRSLTLRGATLPFEGAKNVLQSFLSSNCASYQSLVFRDVELSHGSKYMSTVAPPNVTVVMPDCAQEHKSLTLRCTSQLAAWMLHQKEVKLKSLTVDPNYEQDQQQQMQELFTLTANHPNFHVQELTLPLGTSNRFKSIHARVDLLRKFDHHLGDMSPVAAGLLKQADLGTLRELNLHIRELTPALWNALLSFPRLHIITISSFQNHFPHPSWVERMYIVWKEKSCPSLRKFTLRFPYAKELSVSDTQKAMLEEMSVQHCLKSH